MTIGAAEEVLELPHRYTKEDVRRAYTELARRYHPDAASKHHFDPEAAQQRMVEANKANDVLKQLFSNDPERIVVRAGPAAGGDGAPRGFGIDWRASWEAYRASEEDPLAGDGLDEPVAGAPAASLRQILLGPVVLRVVFIAAFALWWWSAFPLLPHNLPRFLPAGAWTLFDVANLVAAMVYPSYLVVYELLSGYVSGFVRETVNGVVSWATRRYVDVRSRSSRYGCSLSKLIREQVYSVLLAPLVLYAAAACLAQTGFAARAALGAVAVLLGVDALAACARGGLINVWASSLAERVEDYYLLTRARLLKRCGAWDVRE